MICYAKHERPPDVHSETATADFECLYYMEQKWEEEE